MLTNSYTISSSAAVANQKGEEKSFFPSNRDIVVKNFGKIPWTFEENQTAHLLSQKVYNRLLVRLCRRFEGMESDYAPVVDLEMSVDELRTEESLFRGIAPRIDSIMEQKRAKADKCREAGRRGGRPKKGGVSIDCEEKKGSPFSDVVSCSKQEENDAFSNPPGEKNHYKEIREKKVYRNSTSTERKGSRGKRGEDSLPPYIPPEGLKDDSETVYTIDRKMSKPDLESTPRRKWQKRYSHFVTDLGVTWEAFRNVEATEALLTIPCPPDFHTWLPLVISAKRGGVPDEIIDAWSRTGAHYDKDENQYYIDYAKRERAGGITVLLLFRVYNHGFGCVGRFSNMLKSEMAHRTASDGGTASTHTDTGEAEKNAVMKPCECEFTIAKPKTESPKPVVGLVPQIPPQNGVPTENEKRSVLAEYMVNIRGLDVETVEHFGDYAGWDARRGSWYISIRDDGYETKRYLDIPPDSKCEVPNHPRYMVTRNAGLKNHHNEHLFAQDNKTVFLVEGQFDVRALWCAGRYLAVGVKNLDQLEADLKSPELTAMNFVIVSDGDSTGESNAAKWSRILAGNGFTPHVCRLPKGVQDVGEMLKKQGRSAVFNYIENFMVEDGLANPIAEPVEDNPYLDDSWI